METEERDADWSVYRALLELAEWVRDRSKECSNAADGPGDAAQHCAAMASAYQIVRAEAEERCRVVLAEYDRRKQLSAMAEKGETDGDD